MVLSFDAFSILMKTKWAPTVCLQRANNQLCNEIIETRCTEAFSFLRDEAVGLDREVCRFFFPLNIHFFPVVVFTAKSFVNRQLTGNRTKRGFRCMVFTTNPKNVMQQLLYYWQFFISDFQPSSKRQLSLSRSVSSVVIVRNESARILLRVWWWWICFCFNPQRTNARKWMVYSILPFTWVELIHHVVLPFPGNVLVKREKWKLLRCRWI